MTLFGYVLVKKARLVGLEQENALLAMQRGKLEEALFLAACLPPVVQAPRRRKRRTIEPVNGGGVH